jgi:hypothetical protein
MWAGGEDHQGEAGRAHVQPGQGGAHHQALLTATALYNPLSCITLIVTLNERIKFTMIIFTIFLVFGQ